MYLEAEYIHVLQLYHCRVTRFLFPSCLGIAQDVCWSSEQRTTKGFLAVKKLLQWCVKIGSESSQARQPASMAASLCVLQANCWKEQIIQPCLNEDGWGARCRLAGWLGDCYNNYKRILAERLLGDNLLAQENVFEWKISARFTTEAMRALWFMMCCW